MIRHSVLAFTGAVALGIGLTSTAHAASIVTNGSFEDGGFSGWTTAGNVFAIPDVFAPASDGNVFASFLNLNGGTPSGSIAQELSTTVGQKYELSFDFGKGSEIGGIAALDVIVDGLLTETVSDGTGGEANPYEAFKFYFTADAETVNLSFSDASESATGLGAFLDNITVKQVEVPEAASGLAVLAVGAIMVGARKKRQVI